MRPPDLIARDTMARRRFDAGRRAGLTYAQQAPKGPIAPAPGLPTELRPADPGLLARADAAYEMGYQQQVKRERNAANHTGLIAGLVLAGLGLGGMAVFVAVLGRGVSGSWSP